MTQETMDEIRSLAASREHKLAPHMLTGDLTPAQAERVLENLRRCPPATPVSQPAQESRDAGSSAPPPMAAFKDVPAGYFATRRDDGTIDYWRVEKGKRGKWEGYSFARRVLGGISSDDRRLRTVDLANIQQRLALQAITETGVEASANLFAVTLTRCKRCSIPLTDPVSRSAGLGPDCRTKATEGR